jgi:radical SAM protein with 4Fe4S-binding SPASM domain
MKREKGVMDDEIFLKIVKQARDMSIQDIYPFLNGEPFLDPRIYKRLSVINNVYGTGSDGANIIIYSNLGVALREVKKNSSLLRKCIIVVSIAECVNREVREENISKLKDAMTPMSIHTINTPDLIQEADLLSKKYNIPGTAFSVFNWAGLVESDNKFQDGYCCRSRDQICILWDGRVTLCCMTMEGDPIIGDLRTQSLEIIWNSDTARLYRENIKSKLNPCIDCNMQVVTE